MNETEVQNQLVNSSPQENLEQPLPSSSQPQQPLQKQPQPRSQWRQLLPGLAISIVCLVYVFWLAKPWQVLEVLKKANYTWVISGFIASILWLLVRAQVWRQLLRGRPSYSQAFFTAAEGYLLNNLLPFRLGEIARSLLMAEKINLSFWEVFSTVIVERLLDIIFAISLLVTALFFVFGTDMAWLAASAIAILVLLLLAFLYFLARKRDRIVARFEKMTKQWAFLSRTASQFLTAFLTGFAVMTESGRFIQVLLWMILNLAIAILQYYCFMKAFIPEAKILYAAVTLGVAALSSAIPSLPGAVGVMEFVMVAALSIIALPKAAVLTIGLAMRAAGYLISGIFGAIGLAKDGETFSGIYHKARSIRQKPAI